MNAHERIVRFLRESVAKDSSPLAQHLDGYSDEQVYHKIFYSYRGKGGPPKGLRLSWLGLEMLSTYTQSFDIEVPEGYKIGSHDLLWLDGKAKMPYYIGYGEREDGRPRLVVFEAKLGITLKLADGMISNLRDMEA